MKVRVNVEKLNITLPKYCSELEQLETRGSNAACLGNPTQSFSLFRKQDQ